MADHIIQEIKPTTGELNDKPIWTGNTLGQFTVKSAYHILRNKKDKVDWAKMVWLKGLPYKISFFLWRVMHGRIPTDDNLKRMRISIVSKCCCCEEGEMETMNYLFLTAPIAIKLWRQFVICAGFSLDGHNLYSLMFSWWEFADNLKGRSILKAIPAVLMWELWKRRNSIRTGKKMSFIQLLHNCLWTMQQLIKAKFPNLRNLPWQWSGCYDRIQGHRSNLFYHIVRWQMPETGWVKCNTDGACKGNPRISSYGFCIRDVNGDLLYAESDCIGVTTNIRAELTAILRALDYCNQHLLNHVILETDSLTLKNMLRKEWKIPWELIQMMETIDDMMTQMNVQVQHIFREGNQVADYLANLAINQQNKQQYHTSNQLPTLARRFLNMDKQQIPAIRIRSKRIVTDISINHSD